MKTITFLFITILASIDLSAAQGLSGGSFNPAGAFQLDIQGGPLLVEYSTNLSTWQTNANSRGSLVDSSSTNSPWRFYRARSGGGITSNVVGYVRIPVEAGKMAVVASPFAGSLRLDQAPVRTAVFGNAAPPVQISLAQNGKQTAYTYDEFENNFVPKIPEIPAGTGFIVRNNGQNTINVVFTGELPQGNLKRTIPQGETLVAALVPRPGPVNDALGAFPMEGAQLKVWNEQTQAYQTSTYDKQANRWIPSLNYKPGRAVFVKYPELSFQTTYTAAGQ